MGGSPPKLKADHLYATLRTFAGSSQPMSIVIMVALLALFQWFCNAIYTPLQDWRLPYLLEWICIVAFPGALSLLWLKVRKMQGHVMPSVVQEQVDGENVQKVMALILFLSPCGKDMDVVKRWCLDEKLGGKITEKMPGLQGAWRMSLEAITLHLGRLKHVAVICSANAPDKQDGTWQQFDDFSELVQHLAGEKIDMFDASKRLFNNDEGVDYEDADALIRLVNHCFLYFHDEHYLATPDILVDITGGTKLATASGATVALAEGRRFQYVSTRDYSKRIYNITYSIEK